MSDCVFCKIREGEIPTEFIHESDEFMVFNDIHPSAPVHILIVPKEHVSDLGEVTDDLWNKLKQLILDISKKKDMKGFRIANNYGDAAMIDHFHLHLLSGIKKDRKV